MRRFVKYHKKDTDESNYIIKEYKGICKLDIDNLQNEYENTINNDIYDIKVIKDETSSKQAKYFNCILILKDEDLNKIIYKSNFSFINSENNQYLGFVFYPKMINELYDKLYTYVNKNYVLYLCANNVWYEYKFISKIHELDVRIGTLKYKYWMNDLSYIYNKYHEYKSNDN